MTYFKYAKPGLSVCFRYLFVSGWCLVTVGASSAAVAHLLDSLCVFSGTALLESRGPSGMLLPGASAFASAAFFMPGPLLGLSGLSLPHCPPHLLPLARFSRDLGVAVIIVALTGLRSLKCLDTSAKNNNEQS